MLRETDDLTRAPRTAASGFRTDEAGSMTALALLLFVCMVIIGGISIDLMMFENNRTRMQNLSDRAALAAADLDQELNPRAVVQSYFEKEGMDPYLKNVQVVSRTNERMVRVETEQVQRTMFLNFWNHTGVDTLTPRASATAAENRTDLEISLVLDVSNSMNWASSAPGSTSKLADLKSAANRFVDKIYANANPDQITVNLVPYATHVNVGPAVMSALSVTPKHTYSNCLAFKDADFNATTIRSTNAYKHTAHFDQWYYDQAPQLYVCRNDSDQIVQAVMHDPTRIKQAISALTANGNTSIEIGMKWGSALLDPSAKVIVERLITDGTVHPAYGDRPFAWGRNNTAKYVVLLTDGVNTVQQEMNDAYANGDSGVWRWTPNPLLPFKFYSWYSPEVGDEDGDGILREGYFNPGITLPTGLTGLAGNVTIGRGWTATPMGQTLSELRLAGGNSTANATLKAQLIAALTPINQPPVQLDYSALWNEMSVRHFAWYYVRNRNGNSDAAMNSWYSRAWSAVTGPTKDARLLTLCDKLRTKGVTIFTIGFEVTDYSADVLESCTDNANYSIRVVGDDLEAAFDSIANTISKLKLTQ